MISNRKNTEITDFMMENGSFGHTNSIENYFFIAGGAVSIQIFPKKRLS